MISIIIECIGIAAIVFSMGIIIGMKVAERILND